MTKSIFKSIASFALIAGILLTSVAPSVFAQGQYRTRRGDYINYDRNRDYNYQRQRDYEYERRNQDYRYDDYNYDQYRRNNTKQALKRTGIGAAIGAAGGALLGGRKGALIGGVVGAAGGYIYHRNKVNNGRY